MGKNYYEILGVGKDADEKELKKQYRKLSLQYHPDRQSGKSEEEKKAAEEKFKEVAEAYSVLSDPEKRKEYDMGGRSFGGFDTNDIFREFMKDRFAGFGSPWGFGNEDKNQTPRGLDKRIRIGVTIQELYCRSLKDITYQVYRPCDNCDGRGTKNGNVRTCPHCNGTGYITKTVQMQYGYSQTMHQCEHCGGTGTQMTDPCHKCHGSGLQQETVKRRWQVPYIDEMGKKYKIIGDGNSCERNNGSNGDLIYEYVLVSDDKYTLDENNPLNIITSIDVPILTMITGGDVDIRGVGGEGIKMHIPMGMKSGTMLSVKGHGLETSRHARGNLLVTVNGAMPSKLNSKEKEILNKLKESENFKK